jgi:predicted nucleic-acid-binding protein
MRLTVDTNILVRAAIGDDIGQAETACRLLKQAELIAVSLPCLCEFVWVLRRAYGLGHKDISLALQNLLNAANVAVNRPAADAGLAVLDAGGDFADGVIAFEGQWLGGQTFISFDRKAVDIINTHGLAAMVPP